jgi:hypothetical protein
VLRTHDVLLGRLLLVIQKLRDVRAAVGDVDPQRRRCTLGQGVLRRQRRDTLTQRLPQAAFTVGMLLPRLSLLALGNLATPMKHLAGQPQNLPGRRRHGQTVMAVNSPTPTVADLTQFRDGRQARIVENRGVVEEQHHARRRLHLRQRHAGVQRHHLSMRDPLGSHQPIKPLQIGRLVKPLRKCLIGVGRQLLGDRKQTGIRPLVPQVRRPKLLLRKRCPQTVNGILPYIVSATDLAAEPNIRKM